MNEKISGYRIDSPDHSDCRILAVHNSFLLYEGGSDNNSAENENRGDSEILRKPLYRKSWPPLETRIFLYGKRRQHETNQRAERI